MPRRRDYDDTQGLERSFVVIMVCFCFLAIGAAVANIRYLWRNAPITTLSMAGSMVVALGTAVVLHFKGRLRFRKMKNRVTKNLCLACGYDMRASDTRCPECGHVRPDSVERVDALDHVVNDA